MGSTFGDIGKKFSDFDNGAEVSGTGNTVGELRNLGYGDKELTDLGAQKESTRLTRALQGGVAGFNAGQRLSAPAGGASGSAPFVPVQQQEIDPSFYGSSDYLEALRKRFQGQ